MKILNKIQININKGRGNMNFEALNIVNEVLGMRTTIISFKN